MTSDMTSDKTFNMTSDITSDLISNKTSDVTSDMQSWKKQKTLRAQDFNQKKLRKSA